MGPDVILVHRLLKNHVTETLGTTAYVWLTDALLERARGTLGLPAHAEHYDDLGEVRGRVVDLGQAVVRHRDARIFVERSEADLELITPLPVPRAIAWEYHIDPRKRMRWQLDARGIEARPNAAGRAGVGWESHCDHGAYTLVQRAVDWRPFEYLTLESELIVRGPVTLAADPHHLRVQRGRTHPMRRLHPRAGERPRPVQPHEDSAGRRRLSPPVPRSLQGPGPGARRGRRACGRAARRPRRPESDPRLLEPDAVLLERVAAQLEAEARGVGYRHEAVDDLRPLGEQLEPERIAGRIGE